VGCREHDARTTLVRLVATDEGVALDPSARAGGRGAWVHASRRCIEQAVQRHAAERTLKVPAQKSLDAGELLAALREAMTRRITSLLVVASRTRTLAIGADAVEETLGRKGPAAAAVVFAADAGETAQRIAQWAAEPDERPEGAGREAPPRRVVKVVKYGTKSELGRVFGRAEIALLALTDGRIATELVTTIERMAGLEDRV
jgi:predicted RNA-binding protein YlxR (DUF448 family)